MAEKHFLEYLDEIESLIKAGDYERAWKVSNKYLITVDIKNKKEDMWFMVYYQQALISYKEKKYDKSLFLMGLVIHFGWEQFNPEYGGVGGFTHQRFVNKLLKKFNKTDKFDEYINICKLTKPNTLESRLSAFLAA